MRARVHTMVLAALAAILPIAVAAQTSQPACNLATSTMGDYYANTPFGPKGEDMDFFVNTGGVPGLMFLLDTSASMVRLPPDGAAGGWGSFETLGNATAGLGYGCSNGDLGVVRNPDFVGANNLVFNSPCGQTTIEGQPFNNATDFTNATDSSGAFCPYMIQGNQPPSTNKPGFDPDFYCGSGTSCGSKPNYFDPVRVFHDAAVAVNGQLTGTYSSLNPSGDGWSSSSVFPHAASSWTSFCANGTWTAAKRASCSTCFQTRGYWFEGSYFWPGAAPTVSCGSTANCYTHGYGTCVQNGQDVEYEGGDPTQGRCKVPNVWFSGNFLNFFPPKFVMARKALKDTLQSVRRVRLGLATLDSSGFGAKMLQDINPPCNLVYPPSKSSFDSNRTSILNAINDPTKLTFGGGTPLAEALLHIGQYFRTHADSSHRLPWFNSTFQKSGLDEKSGANVSWCFQCQKNSVLIITDGAPSQDGKIPGNGVNGPLFASQPMTLNVSKQGGSYAGMAGYNITGITCSKDSSGEDRCNSSAEKPDPTMVTGNPGNCAGQEDSGGCDDNFNPVWAYLPKVAWYLHHMDLRHNKELDAACQPMTDHQGLNIYTIGLGLGVSSKTALVLQHAAYSDAANSDDDVGGGLYKNAQEVSTLRDAINAVFNDVNTRSTSFGAAAVSTLQTTAGVAVLVPRFDPRKTAHWQGHLYRFTIFSEFAAGCTETDPSGTITGAGDLDCDHYCNSVFLKDANAAKTGPGNFIQEDSSGHFKKNVPDLPNCGPSNKCSQCGAVGTADATPWWEAGAEMLKKRWSERNVLTVVDQNSDGAINSQDPLISVAQGGDVPDSVADLLTPYATVGGSTCKNLALQLSAAGNPDSTVILNELNGTDPKGLTNKYHTCVKDMLRYMLGADLFNERAATSSSPQPWPPTAITTTVTIGGVAVSVPIGVDPATLFNRTFLLGDIFHSSPVVVIPPVKKGPFCEDPYIAEPQCVMSLYSTSPGHERYDYYACPVSPAPKPPCDPAYRRRDQFALAGANDLMLHAFHYGTWKSGDNTDTSVDESKPPYDGYWDTGATTGGGEEIWAFVPPDLLPKLPLFVGMAGAHQYYVDATPAVKDVWVDGTSNKLGSGIVDDVKQESEYHTVAVMGERRGGTHYFALDITDAAKNIDAKPKFLWIYPQPTSPQSEAFGWSFQGFLPHPPTIGPVRIQASTVYAATQTGPTAAGSTVPFHDRYVTFLSGGYDPLYARGHGVHMVDVWTGDEIWDFSEPASGAAGFDPADPRRWLKFPVAATVGMAAWGKSSKRLGTSTTESWFDTATFGDTGGQVWALRFYDPGQIDPNTGKVTNWWGARLFQGGGVSSTVNLKASQPFFNITSNVFSSVDSSLRVVLGSGDSMNLLDTNGGACGPDNMRACTLSGCSLNIDASFTDSGPPGSYTVTNASIPASGADTMTFSTSSGGGSCGTTASSSSVDLMVSSCPFPAVAADDSTEKIGGGICTVENNTFSCKPNSLDDDGAQLAMSSSMPAITLGNCFYVMKVFDESHHPIFNDLAGAKTYDSNRISELTTYSGVPALKKIDPNNVTLTTSDLADTSFDGWTMCYNHTAQVTVSGATYNVAAVDERTSTSATVPAGLGCAFWSTLQPLQPQASSSGVGCSQNPCKAGKAEVAYQYGAKIVTGDLCLGYSSATNSYNTRSIQWTTYVPPPPETPVTFVNAGGQVTQGVVTVRVPAGASSTPTGPAEDLTQMIEWIDVDQATHQCRHTTGGTCQ